MVRFAALHAPYWLRFSDLRGRNDGDMFGRRVSWSRRRNAPIRFVVLVGSRNRAEVRFNFKSGFAARLAGLSELLLARQK
jgi:hypothetical protein